jgi:hypothetical protein
MLGLAACPGGNPQTYPQKLWTLLPIDLRSHGAGRQAARSHFGKHKPAAWQALKHKFIAN